MPKWLGQSPFFYTHTSATSIVDGGFHTSQMTSSEPFVMCCLFQASFSPRGTVSLSLPDTVMISSPFKPGKPASTQASLQSSQLLKMMLLYCPRPGAQRSERYLTPFFWLHKHAERPVATQSGGALLADCPLSAAAADVLTPFLPTKVKHSGARAPCYGPIIVTTCGCPHDQVPHDHHFHLYQDSTGHHLTLQLFHQGPFQKQVDLPNLGNESVGN